LLIKYHYTHTEHHWLEWKVLMTGGWDSLAWPISCQGETTSEAVGTLTFILKNLDGLAFQLQDIVYINASNVTIYNYSVLKPSVVIVIHPVNGGIPASIQFIIK
jgi:hypothetical protein